MYNILSKQVRSLQLVIGGIMNGNINLGEYLTQQPDDKQLILLSFFVTNPVALDKLKAQWALRDVEHSIVLGRITEDMQILPTEDFGGSVALIDPLAANKGFLTEIPVPSAFGLCVRQESGSLYVASNSVLSKIKGGRCIQTLNNPLFNDLHTCAPSLSGNLLVVATGVDAVLEVDFEDASKVYWDWLATEHGYNTTATGNIRVIDRKFNYQSVVTVTPEHTTHINTAINDRPNRILVTLFHQGEIIEIDMPSKRSKCLMSGLKSPHNIRLREGGFMVSDTRANRVLLLDNNFAIEREITGMFDWVQDALELDGNLGYLIADSNNDRLVLSVASGQDTVMMQWAKNSRKFAAMEYITVLQARSVFLPL